MRYFNPLPPWGGRPYLAWVAEYNPLISIHSLRGEGDKAKFCNRSDIIKFQSTPSVGRETIFVFQKVQDSQYFNPLPPWGGRLNLSYLVDIGIVISIHSLRGEGDVINHRHLPFQVIFQSTPSVGRETLTSMSLVPSFSTFQSTPSVGRETKSYHCVRAMIGISIHSLRGEGDAISGVSLIHRGRFQSTPSVGRETGSASQHVRQE